MKKEIVVSICCITYNHEKYIAEAIESFLMQKTNFNFEILIHDDASTDNTAAIIKKYEKKYPEIIKPIYQKENQYSKGKLISQNNYNRAKGKYIAICEGDDYWTDSYKLQKQVDYMEKNMECGGCFHAGELINAVTKKKVGEVKPFENDKILTAKDTILGGGGFVVTNSILCRTELLKNLPTFYLNAPVEDYPLQILVSMNKYAFYIKDTMSVYRVGIPTSWTGKKKIKSEILNHNSKIEKMMLEINEYSNRKYENEIKRKIKILKFDELIIKNDIKILKKRDWEELYNKLNLKKKLRIHLEYYFPKTMEFLLNIYKKIRYII